MKLNKTYLPKKDQLVRKCYVIDASDKVLGRIAAKAAAILRGKHKTIYTPNMDTGDTVIIINAAKLRVTGKKTTDKIYENYSGYPGGKKEIPFEVLFKKSPVRVMTRAVKCMIPRGSLGFQILTRLRVYANDQHPHQAQKPIALSI